MVQGEFDAWCDQITNAAVRLATAQGGCLEATEYVEATSRFAQNPRVLLFTAVIEFVCGIIEPNEALLLEDDVRFWSDVQFPCRTLVLSKMIKSHEDAVSLLKMTKAMYTICKGARKHFPTDIAGVQDLVESIKKVVTDMNAPENRSSIELMANVVVSAIAARRASSASMVDGGHELTF